MSRERCLAVSQLAKQAISILTSNSVGEGEGVDAALLKFREAVLWISYHMRQNSWTEDSARAPGAAVASTNGAVRSPPSVLQPALELPRLSTGLMQPKGTMQPRPAAAPTMPKAAVPAQAPTPPPAPRISSATHARPGEAPKTPKTRSARAIQKDLDLL